MGQEEDILKSFEKIKKDVGGIMNNIMPDFQATLKNLQGQLPMLKPKLIKDCIINKQKVKVCLHENNNISFEFADKDYAETYYKSIK
jgi:hypothetical protein